MMKTVQPPNVRLFDVENLSETSTIEFKLAQGGLPDSLWESYSAFANTDGGLIVLGVDDSGEQPIAVGVKDPDRLITNFWNTLNGKQKVSANILKNEDVAIENLDLNGEKQFVVIQIPRVDYSQRPVYVGRDPFVGTYRRNHTGDYRCTREEVQRMLADQSSIPNDSRILPGFTFDDVDAETLRQYRQLFNSRQISHQWSLLSDEEFLRRFQAWRTDRDTGQQGLTVAGLVMFGRHEALLDPQNALHYAVDYRRRRSESIGERWDDRFTIDGTWAGNLFQFYQHVFSKLTQGLSVPYNLDSDFVRTASTPVHEAVQEGFVNALVHADYCGTGGIVIERFPDKLVFSNPGTLLVSQQQLRSGGVSVCRNPALQLMFRMTGLGDAAGSGLDKIRSSWKSQHWESPNLSEQWSPDRVILTLPIVTALPPIVQAALQKRFGDLSKLSADEMSVLVYAHMRGGVSNQDLQGDLNLHRTDITLLLQGLKRKGYLYQTGLTKGARYTLPDLLANVSDPSSPVTDPSSPVKDPSLPVTDPSLPVKDPSLPVKDPSLPVKDPSLPVKDPSLPVSGSPSATAAQRRYPSETERLILGYCAGEFRSLREIAQYIGRGDGWTRDRFLSRLIASGKLERKHPSSKSHPEQRYRTHLNES